MAENLFEVTDVVVDRRCSASALWHAIHAQGDSIDEIRRKRQGSHRVLLGDTMRLKLIQLCFDEVPVP